MVDDHIILLFPFRWLDIARPAHTCQTDFDGYTNEIPLMDDQLWEPVNFSGGALCLDFANTLSGWGGPRPRERLNGIGDLLTWTAAAGEIDEREAAALARRAAEAPRDRKSTRLNSSH